jgi:hypothetical protein
VPVVDRTLVVDQAVAAAAAKVVAEDATASQTKITVNQSGSRANRVGSPHVA